MDKEKTSIGDIIISLIIIFYIVICIIALISPSLIDNCTIVIDYLKTPVAIILTGLVGNKVVNNTTERINRLRVNLRQLEQNKNIDIITKNKIN